LVFTSWQYDILLWAGFQKRYNSGYVTFTTDYTVEISRKNKRGIREGEGVLRVSLQQIIDFTGERYG